MGITMAEKIDELITAVQCLARKVAELKTAIKTRNKIDLQNQEREAEREAQAQKRDIERERAAMWERRFLIGAILILAGIDVAKIAGLIK